MITFITAIVAWEDHPDRDEERREKAFDSQCFVGGGYDWSKRDKDNRDDDNSSSGGRDIGTVLPGPDRDK